jgi:hypothetical protein
MVDTDEKDGSKATDQLCCFFEIRVRGHISNEWSDWFEHMDIRLLENGETVLSGPIVDQAALMGILNKLNRLNLPLISLNEVCQNRNIAEGERNGTTSIESQA